MGRDIWGVRIGVDSKDETVCIQCANRKSLSATKAIRDINKVLTSQSGKPDVFKLVCASPVSAKSRDKIKNHAKKNGIKQCEILSGSEFEENIRSWCESLLARFVNGETFPDSADDLKQFAQSLQGPCNVPHPPPPHFVQPGPAWKKLQDATASAPQSVTKRQVIVLYGLHGTGKTQAGCALAWEKRSDYSAILWVRGDSKEVLRSSFGGLCDLTALDLTEQNEGELDKRSTAVRRWLKEHSGWLLVADNMDNKEVRDALFEFIPPSFQGTVLATSCLSDWPPTCNRIEFGIWNPSLCADFFRKRLGITDADMPIAGTIGNLLGGLPIALEQAAAYIEQTRTPLQVYLPKLVADINLELRRHASGSTNYPASFAAVLMQSLLKLSPDSRFLLQLASFLAPEGQLINIYKTIAAHSSPDRIRSHGIQCPLLNPEADVIELNRWSLVRQRGSCFDIHPLVQSVVRDNLTPSEREHRLTVIGRLFFAPFGGVASPTESSNWGVWRAVFPHMETFIAHIRIRGDRRALGYLLNQLGLFLESQGLHKKAVANLKEAVEVSKATFGTDHPDTAAALNNLGELLTQTGRPAEAKLFLRDAIAILDRHKALVPHGESSCWNNLGLCRRALGQRKLAEKAFRKSVALDSMRNGNDDDICLVHQNNLAMLLDDDVKQTEEAEELYRNVISKMKDEVRLAAALTNLGALLYRTKRAAEAIGVLERAARILLKYFPPNHPAIEKTILHLTVARRKASSG
jgi:tetratricopeptide (TPR) repeat protein